jgi:hypothetical protein
VVRDTTVDGQLETATFVTCHTYSPPATALISATLRSSERTLAHCRRDTLDIATPDIADGEHSGQTRFEKVGSPGGRPMRGGQIILRQIRSCLDETFGIERHASIEPLCAGNGAGHDENVSDVVGLDAPGLIVPPAQAFEMTTPFEGHDFRVRSQDNGWILFDATNQIARHALCQPTRPHEHVHAYRGL